LLLHGMFYGKASAGWKISNVQENLSKWHDVEIRG
jgi:hypothetical protein